MKTTIFSDIAGVLNNTAPIPAVHCPEHVALVRPVVEPQVPAGQGMAAPAPAGQKDL